jgi:DNA topoisomerase II
MSANNYVLFDYAGKIRRYQNEEEIMQEFYVLRKTLYERRKDYMLARLRKEFETLSNKVRFILGVISDEIKVSRIKKRVLIQTLKAKGFSTQSELNNILPEKKRPSVVAPDANNDAEEAQAEEEEKLAPGEVPANEYDYLLTM